MVPDNYVPGFAAVAAAAVVGNSVTAPSAFAAADVAKGSDPAAFIAAALAVEMGIHKVTYFFPRSTKGDVDLAESSCLQRGGGWYW